MSTPGLELEKARLEEELRIHRQIAFASGLFYGDVTVRTLLESLAEAVVIIDSSGAILLINSRAEQMFGYQAKEIIGKPHSILIPERFRDGHGKHEADFFAEPKIRPMSQLIELAGLRRDGSEFPVDISLSYIETVNGVLVLAFVSDITLRRQYEANIQKHQELFRVQVECIKDYAIFMLDAHGNVQNWNAGAERLKGYRDEEIVGRHFSCFYSEEDRKAGRPDEALAVAQTEGRAEDEGWRIRKDGSRFWADVIITALRDTNGNLLGFSKVTRDISERKRTENEIKKLNSDLAVRAMALEEANRELEAFNYTVAHDLSKPLTAINGYCQVLRDLCDDKLGEQENKYICEIFDGTCRMNRLIDTLLNFSRLGHTELCLEMIDVSTIARIIAADLMLSEQSRRVDIHIAEGLTACADAGLLHVVLDNLLGNAWKYTRKQEVAVIELGSSDIDDVPTFFVRDNGVGFDMAQIDKLFTPFQRIACADEYRGFGIGLATVERIIRRHGGRIWGEGEPGKGACFYFTLATSGEPSGEASVNNS